jgi:sulfate adenylyltransferase
MRRDTPGDARPRWTLRPRQQRTLERLLDGGFAPLHGFLGRADYDSVLLAMRLADGTPWPFPVTLDVDEAFAVRLDAGSRVLLCDCHGTAVAWLDLADIYHPDHLRELRLLYGQMDRRHPVAVELLRHTGAVYLGGRVRDLRDPARGGPAMDVVGDGLRLWGGPVGYAWAIEVGGGSRLLH